MQEKVKRTHFIGAGGVGMSALAALLIQFGAEVSGSDENENSYTEKLVRMGARMYTGHSGANVEGAGEVVFSTAISEDNPELSRARELNIPCLHRSELLERLMSAHERSVAVTGTHGKTTTASMLSSILVSAGFEPTVAVGGEEPSLGTNGYAGSGGLFVCEADESDGSFLNLNPKAALITNIEDDHLDHYGSFGGLKSAFRAFAKKVSAAGGPVICSDHPVNVEVMDGLGGGGPATYGFSEGCSFSGRDFREEFGRSSFMLVSGGMEMGKVELPLPGIHNAENALGAAAAALRLGVGFRDIQSALRAFTGVRRRFERMGEAGGVLVIEDYAHHPAELRFSIDAAKKSGRRVLAVFQPHRFSRTAMLAPGFADGLSPADCVFVTDIYPAGEAPMKGVASRLIIDGMAASGHPSAFYTPRKEDLPCELARTCRPGDIVMILGAGDINKITPAVLDFLGKGALEDK